MRLRGYLCTYAPQLKLFGNVPSPKGFPSQIPSMLQLYYLQLSIISIIEPKAKPINALGALLIHRLFDNYRQWLLDTCSQSKENIQKALNLLDKTTEEYQNLLFEHS